LVKQLIKMENVNSMLCFTIFLHNKLLNEAPSFEFMKKDLTSNYIVLIDIVGRVLSRFLNFLELLLIS